MNGEPARVVRRVRRPAAQTREHILRVAGELFYRHGIRASGVDTVAAAADVAPATLYRLFATKDDLVAAYVERCSVAYKQQLVGVSDASVGTARDRILAIFVLFVQDVGSDTWRGCPFLLVLAEYPDPNSLAHVQAVAHKEWVRSLLHHLVNELADQSPLRDPAALAEQLALVAEGIYGSAQSFGPHGPALNGRALAVALVDGAITQGGWSGSG